MGCSREPADAPGGQWAGFVGSSALFGDGLQGDSSATQGMWAASVVQALAWTPRTPRRTALALPRLVLRWPA
jgi:hypothetical protein